MKIYDVSRLPAQIVIGYDGENNWRPHSFDCSPLLANHPNGTISLWLLPNGETQAFPVALTRNGNSVVWTPLSEEMTAATGALQLVCTDGTDVGKSAVVLFRVDESIVPGADHPATVPSWATETIERAEAAADRAEEAAESIDPEQIEQTIQEAVEAYLDEHPISAPVTSVNGKTGAVDLDAEDVGALPADTPLPAAVTEQTVSGWGFTKNTGDYTKPSGGIPKTDLSQAVQGALDSIAPFEIPVSQSGDAYTTTASAADIVANVGNLVLVDPSGVRYKESSYYANGGSVYAFFTFGDPSLRNAIVFGGYVVSVESNSVYINMLYTQSGVVPEVSSNDNGKFLRVVNGTWAAQAVPAAESASFGGGS